jgi:hypothetical protein
MRKKGISYYFISYRGDLHEKNLQGISIDQKAFVIVHRLDSYEGDILFNY